MIPRSVYVAIGIVLVLFGIYRWGFHKGWSERDVEMQLAIAKANEESRSKEQAMTQQINDRSVKLQEANDAINQKQSALDRAISAGRVRISAPTSCVQAAPSAPAPAGDRNEARAEPNRAADEVTASERATLAAIAEIVAAGDRAINQLNACIDAYNAVRGQMNAQR